MSTVEGPLVRLVLTVVHMSPPHSIDDEDKGDQASEDILATATLYQTLDPIPCTYTYMYIFTYSPKYILC